MEVGAILILVGHKSDTQQTTPARSHTFVVRTVGRQGVSPFDDILGYLCRRDRCSTRIFNMEFTKLLSGLPGIEPLGRVLCST